MKELISTTSNGTNASPPADMNLKASKGGIPEQSSRSANLAAEIAGRLNTGKKRTGPDVGRDRPDTMSTSTVFADSTDSFLDNKDLRRSIQSIPDAISSTALYTIHRLGFGGARRAQVVHDPSRDLSRLYAAVFGSENAAPLDQERVAAQLSTSTFVVALCGAFTWKNIFTGSVLSKLSFINFRDKLSQSMGGRMPFLETQLQSFQTNADTLLRCTYLSWIHDKSAPDAELARVLGMVKCQLANVVVEHLGAGEDATEDELNDSLLTWSEALAEPIKEMLVLRCKVSCAREAYEFSWPAPGILYDPRSMDCVHGDGDAVIRAMFPGLRIEADGPEKVIARALVKTT